ncbi:copper resistance system multicopper oxidase [Hydrogenimonas sp.]
MRRRDFLKGSLSMAAAEWAMGLPAFGSEAAIRKPTRELRGREFHLTLEPTVVNIAQKPQVATLVNGMLPGPTLRWREGEEVTIHVTNKLPVSSSIHWHGIILPYQMDGVPGVSFDGIAPGETFTYRFKVRQSGTYWYHSHSGFQEQSGLHGTIIIDPADGEPFDYDREYVVSLSDWSLEKPESIYRKLKIRSDYYNYNQRTLGDFWDEVSRLGFVEAFRRRKMWNEMRMSDRDLSDVTAATYTYLMNGMSDAQNWEGRFRPGERVRLRLVNQSAMTIFDVRIPGLKMQVVAADGNPVRPVTVEELRIGVAESYDVIVEPPAGRYAIFAQSIERSDFVAGSLTSRPGLRAPRPKMDAPQSLTMADMGMGDGKSMAMKGMAMPKMEPAHHGMAMKMGAMKEGGHSWPVTPLPEKEGVAWTMRAKDPRYRLDDPGVGLRHNGRRVLTYADLESLGSADAHREPDREIVMHLTGNMERYIWAINGIVYREAEPLVFHHGERIRITFVNDTMMHHPMHLHGMWSDLERGEGKLVRKHTVLVQPGSKLTIRVTVDAPGRWVFHCHMLYHMIGMFRDVEVV